MGQTSSAPASSAPGRADSPAHAPGSTPPVEDAPFDVTARPEEPEEDPFVLEGPFVQVLYGSQTLNAQRFAHKLGQKYAIKHSPLPVRVTAMDQFEPDTLAKCPYVLLIVSTHTDGVPPDNAKLFYSWLEDAVADFRVQRGYLNKTRFAVFGLGSSDYKSHFNSVGKQMKAWMRALGAKPLCRHAVADYSDSVDAELTPEGLFEQWALGTVLPAVTAAAKAQKDKDANAAAMAEQLKARQAFAAAAAAAGEKGEGAAEVLAADAAADAAEAAVAALGGANSDVDDDEDEDEDDVADDDDEDEDDEDDEEGQDEGEGLVDVEDMGLVSTANDNDETAAKGKGGKKPARQMLSERQRANLTKQGYKIIGSHSGVKLCRWTKAMLRGRGGCYKHTFYGITSYQCMEMTPSLACANKCVFCWRHHTNPVGKEWKWETDNPDMVLAGAIENHRKMINSLKGVPGVQPSRFLEALTPRHCAMSLVGEPIMYPYINQFLDLLHDEGISSFLVTNAQFPQQMRDLGPVTQLYLSIDAHSPESLKRVDRPLNEDYWDRYLECMRLLGTKQQRTVYRLTLVKGFNMDEVAEYARLVALASPTFIEIKGVTYCGDGSGLNMGNVPFHEEVRAWCQALCGYLDGRYELACEHRHSCCILISDVKMKGEDGTWHTWINYPKFLELERAHREKGISFTAADYSAPTPAWAVFGAEEEGFSPNETRVRNKGKYSAAKQAAAAAAAAAEAEAAAAGAAEEGCGMGACGCKGGEEQQQSTGAEGAGCCRTAAPAASTPEEEGCCGGAGEGGECCRQ